MKKKILATTAVLSLGLTMFGGGASTFAAENKVTTNNIAQTISQKSITFNNSDKIISTKEYKDTQYPFTLQISDSWINNVHVDRNQFNEMAKGTINFMANIKGKEYPMCSILVFDNEDSGYVGSGPFIQKLTETNKLIYTYVQATEAPMEYYQGEGQEEFKKMYDMIREEISKVMHSFKLQV